METKVKERAEFYKSICEKSKVAAIPMEKLNIGIELGLKDMICVYVDPKGKSILAGKVLETIHKKYGIGLIPHIFSMNSFSVLYHTNYDPITKSYL